MKKCFVLTLVVALVVSFMLGLYLYRLNVINEQIAFEAEYKNMQSQNIIKEAKSIIQETSSNKSKISPNTRIIQKTYYNVCEHLVETEENMPERLINKTETEFQAEYIGWEIQKFTIDEIIIYKEVNDFCDEHFLLKDVEGEIIVYGLDKYDNEKEVIKETGIQTKYLSEIDIDNLKKGIKVCGLSELNQMLEDFE